jgi:DNA modification methylase
MKILQVSIDKLIPYVNNSRTHSDEQIAQVAASIKEFGFTNPVLTDGDHGIIAGHGRVLAARKLGMNQVPCIELSHLTKNQRKAYIIADNKLALNSGWDDELLKIELDELDTDGFDISLTGFTPEELDALIVTEVEGLTDEDAVPEPPIEPITKLGDVWILGNHRVMCGDSTSIDQVEQLMDGKKAELLFTSPPYSDMREYNGNKDLSIDNLINFIPTYLDYAEYQVINLGIQRKDNNIVSYWDYYIAKAKDCGYKFLSWNVWCKTSAGSIGNQTAFFPICHEWIFVFGKEFKDINRTEEKKCANRKTNSKNRQKDGSIKESSMGIVESLKELESWHEITPELGSIRKDHPATFPVLLPEKYILAITNANDVVVEPFGGSGTTLIACEKTGREARLMELDEKYCDVIVKRWQDFTGNKAVLEGDTSGTHI